MKMGCKYCSGNCRKAGTQKNGVQRYYCKSCKKYQQQTYNYTACQTSTDPMIIKLVRNGVGMRSISRIMNIAVSTVIRKVKRIAERIKKPALPLGKNAVEIDELRTFVGAKIKPCWVAYVLCSDTRQIIDFSVGGRTKQMLSKVVNTAILSGVKCIKTDGLLLYKYLIPPGLHISNAYKINYIERYNLNLRTHLKRLQRRTICFSRSKAMLEACLKIYFWGESIDVSTVTIVKQNNHPSFYVACKPVKNL